MRRAVVAVAAAALAGCNALFPLEEFDFEPGDGRPDAGSCECLPPAGCWDSRECLTLRDVALGDDFGCALFDTGTVRCWGDNDAGQLADGTRIDRPGTHLVRGLPRATAIAAGARHACAVTEDMHAWCWGANEHGQLGRDDTSAAGEPAEVRELMNVEQIAAGTAHTCARTTEGLVWCWGTNSLQQLGNGGGGSQYRPALVAAHTDMTNIRAIDSGAEHSCALDVDGEVFCWGSNTFLQARGVAGTHVPAPERVATDILAIALGAHHSCGITSTGQVSCWGANHFGQSSSDGEVATMRLVAGVGNSRSLAAGERHTCAVSGTPPTVQCWGDHALGQLGIGPDGGDRAADARDIETAAGEDTVIRAGAFTTCAVHPTRGAAECWGSNLTGELITDRERAVPQPRAIDIGMPATHVAVGDGYACASTATGVSCWGRNDLGQTGSGGRATRSTPAAVVGVTAPSAGLEAGRAHTCAWSTGQLRCWGDNRRGEIDVPTAGIGRPVVEAVEVVPEAGFAIADVALGEDHSCAVSTAGPLLCWGDNNFAQLARSPSGEREPPAPVAGREETLRVGAGDNHTCVVSEVPSVLCWGANLAGQVGAPMSFLEVAAVSVTVPVRVGADIDGGLAHSCAMTGGQVFCWGGDGEGQLGDGTSSDDTSVPVDTGLTGIVGLALGSFHSCAWRADGTLACWGLGRHGELGNEMLANAEVPVPVSITGVAEVAAGRDATCAVDEAGVVRCWGSTDGGQLATPGEWLIDVPRLLPGSPRP